MSKKHCCFVLAFIAVVLFSACNRGMQYQSYEELSSDGWNKDSLVVFNADLEDLAPSYNLYLNVRNSQEYAYSNLWLFIDITSPTGETVTDTVELTLAEPSGKWLGSGLGDLYDNSLLYKQDVAFTDAGVYKITIQQGMRADVLEGIHDIGISIEQNK